LGAKYKLIWGRILTRADFDVGKAKGKRDVWGKWERCKRKMRRFGILNKEQRTGEW